MSESRRSIDWPGNEFVCDCNIESLRVMVNEDGEIEFGIWCYRGAVGPMPFRERLRFAWQTLRRGHLGFGDDIVLNASQSRALALWLGARLRQPMWNDNVVWTMTNDSTANG